MTARASVASIAERLAELRQRFDASFAEPARPEAEERESALAIRVAERPLAVRIRELAGVEACRNVVRLPGGPAGLLGLAGVRGQLVATYDLAALLGVPRGRSAPPRWILLCAGQPEIGLAIAKIEGYVRFSGADVRADGTGLGDHAPELLLHDGATRGLLRVASIVVAVTRRASGEPKTSKEDP